MRENIYGPENRVVSAKLGGALYVESGYTQYAEPPNKVYANRFPSLSADPHKYVDDLVPKNEKTHIPDSYYTQNGLVGGGAKLNTLSITAVSSGIFYSDREVFANGKAIFSPRLPVVAGMSIANSSFRRILGVSPPQLEGEEGAKVSCLYIYYFLCDWKTPTYPYVPNGYSMTDKVGASETEQTAKVHVLCCDRYVTSEGAWVLDEDGSKVVEIPNPLFENGTTLGSRVAVTAATCLEFFENTGICVVSVRSVAYRHKILQKGGNVRLGAHLGATFFQERNMQNGHCPRYFCNTKQTYFLYSAPLETYDLVYGQLYKHGSGMPIPMTGVTWWQEERNYLLQVDKATATFTLDENELRFSVAETGGSPTGNQTIYSTGSSRLLSTFTDIIYVPDA